jgi:hypothetical protein
MAELLLGAVGLITLVVTVLGVAAIIEMIRSPYKN